MILLLFPHRFLKPITLSFRYSGSLVCLNTCTLEKPETHTRGVGKGEKAGETEMETEGPGINRQTQVCWGWGRVMARGTICTL